MGAIYQADRLVPTPAVARKAPHLADYRFRRLGRGEVERVGGEAGIVLRDRASAAVEVTDLDERRVIVDLDGRPVADPTGWQPVIAGEASILEAARTLIGRWAEDEAALAGLFGV